VQFLIRDLFGNVQDADLLASVLQACGNPQLWRWISCSYSFIFKPLETLRRWGMVCECHEEEGAQGLKFWKCSQNGRRLRGVWKIVKAYSDD